MYDNTDPERNRDSRSEMNLYGRLGLLALLAAALLTLAACGQSEPAQQEEPAGEEEMNATDGHGEMDHDDMEHGDMGHEGMEHGDMRAMLEEDGEYSDERFIDHMVPHHEGAVDMAEVALENSARPEVLELSKSIIASQEAEIEELKDIKEREFGTREVEVEMDHEDRGMMEAMGMSMSPEELARQEPFDRAFIGEMIPHHESAMRMAEVALEESENPEIRDLAGGIIEEQDKEIAQLAEWREEWYPEG
jgi:uncharacterized protein (DUF305 family)